MKKTKLLIVIAILAMISCSGQNVENKDNEPPEPRTSITQVGGGVYFVEHFEGAVKRVDIATKEVAEVAKFLTSDGKLTGLLSVVVDKANGVAYAGAALDSKITRIDILTGEAEVVSTKAISPSALRISPDKSSLYAADQGTDDLLKINIQSGENTTIANLRENPPATVRVDDMDILGADLLAEWGVEMLRVNVSTGAKEKLISYGCFEKDNELSFIRGIRVNQAGTYVYLICAPNKASESDLARFDLKTKQLETLVSIPSSCSRLDVSSDESTVYTSCSGYPDSYSGGKIYKISLATDKVEEWLTGLKYPLGIDLVE